MTVHKRWENERSRDRFSPHYLEHREWKWGDYGGYTGVPTVKGGGKK